MATRTRRAKAQLPPLYVAEWIALDGRSDAEIADACGFDRTQVYKWRTRQILRPREFNRVRLATCLGIHYLDFYRSPSRASTDAILRNAPDSVAALVADIATAVLKSFNR